MPTAVNVTRLFSLALGGGPFSGPNMGFVMQPAGGPLMLPDDTSKWVELESNSNPRDGGMHPELVSPNVHGAMFGFQVFFRSDAVGLTQGPGGIKFPDGTTMQFGMVAPPGVDLAPRPNATDPSPYCWWDTIGTTVYLRPLSSSCRMRLPMSRFQILCSCK